MAQSEWLRRSAHVEDVRIDQNSSETPENDRGFELEVRHHCHNDHEHRSWIPAPAALASRTPPYSVAVMVHRDECARVRFESDDAVNSAGLAMVAVAVLAMVVIVILAIVL